MSLITDRTAPPDVPTTNALDDIVDPDAVDPAEIRAFGKTLLTVADPPAPGDTIVLLVRLRVYDVGTEFNENGEGEGTPYRKTKLVSCWKPGSTEPQPKKSKADLDAEAEAAAAENQPALYEDEPIPGIDSSEPEALGDILNDTDPEDNDVDRPPFSDSPQ